MANVINVYRGGYRLGVADGMAGRRRRANWELWFLRPLLWIPCVDVASFTNGYADGYGDGSRLTLWRQNQIL